MSYKMKAKGKYFWKKEWYSICSMHRDGKDGCPMCETGKWVNVWMHNVSSFIYGNWPNFWRWWANLSWNKKKRMTFEKKENNGQNIL
jgi:hypothetical protein